MNELARSIMTIGCRDCEIIPKCSQAGQTISTSYGDAQVMHNGLLVKAGGYHGDWMAQIIRSLKGHHEPQEELVFHHILKYVRHRSLMVELGSFWAYYSLWYLREVPYSKAVCIEPDPRNMKIGQHNAQMNDLTDRIIFKEASAGRENIDKHELISDSDGSALRVPCMNMTAISALSNGQQIELLHLDVQGAELEVINSIEDLSQNKPIRFVFASTHHQSISGSSQTHSDCVSKLKALGANILIEHSVQESFSGDGLIVASFFEEDRAINLPTISRNRAATSLFPDQ
jgi:FkbM family methyltransferase